MTKAEYINLVINNPGKTATELGKIAKVKWSTISSILCKLAKRDSIVRAEQVGMKGGNNKAWRYYPKPFLDLE